MLHGDISNQAGYTIAFRCEDSLFKPKKGKFVDIIQKLAPGLRSRFIADNLNTDYLRAIEYLYRNTEFTVDVVIQEDNYSAHIKHVLEDIPFNRVIKVRNQSAIATRLNMGDITYYIDEDDYRRSLTNHRYAIPLSKLNTLLKGRF